MPSRVICPHCHGPVDPGEMDLAFTPDTEFLICRECDEPILLPPRCPAPLAEVPGLAEPVWPACAAPVADRVP